MLVHADMLSKSVFANWLISGYAVADAETLTRCGLVKAYDDINLGQHWLWQWLFHDGSFTISQSAHAAILYNEFEN